MKSSKIYIMNGKQFKSMMEIARELGRKRVYPKDFEKLGIQCVDADDVANYQQLKLNTDIPKVKKETKKTSEKAKTSPKEKAKKPKTDKKYGSSQEITEALDMAGKVSVEDFSEFIKHFSLKSLEKLSKK